MDTMATMYHGPSFHVLLFLLFLVLVSFVDVVVDVFVFVVSDRRHPQKTMTTTNFWTRHGDPFVFFVYSVWHNTTSQKKSHRHRPRMMERKNDCVCNAFCDAFYDDDDVFVRIRFTE